MYHLESRKKMWIEIPLYLHVPNCQYMTSTTPIFIFALLHQIKFKMHLQ